MRSIMFATIIASIFVVGAFAQDEITPVLYFSFEEEDDEIIDVSGNGNNGTIFGEGNFVEGKYGMGIELGGPDTIDVLHSDTLVFLDELTVGVWVNLEAVANQKIIGKSPIGSGWVLGVNGGIYPEVWDKNGTNHTITQGSVTAGEWTHLAMTYNTDTEQMLLYINGEQVAELANGGNPIGDTNNQMVIGASPWGKDWTSAGIYDEIKLYNVAFDADQVVNMLMEEGVGSAAVSANGKISSLWGEIKIY
ncbi:hypothetical protein GF312_05760 [Candidatus Poribacteria bacterium]|nr:hypothetical protein [Candidatus Poribacteria bacterium]